MHFKATHFAGVCHYFVECEVDVMPAPEQQARRLVLPVICRDLREAGDVCLVVLEKPELNLDIARAAHALPIEVP